MSKNKIPRLPEEITNQLIECVENLIIDAESYDKGNLRAIKRTAVTLRMLFHDTSMSISILSQITNLKELNLNSHITYPVTKELFYGPIFCATFLEIPRLDYYDTFLFHPERNFKYNKISFDDWWNGIVFKMTDTIFTRRSLILFIANTDGGAHLDPNINKNYRHFINGDTGFTVQTPWEFRPFVNEDYEHKDIHFKDIHFAILREITDETITSLIEHFSLPLIYKPNLDYNWQRKINSIGFHLTMTEN